MRKERALLNGKYTLGEKTAGDCTYRALMETAGQHVVIKVREASDIPRVQLDLLVREVETASRKLCQPHLVKYHEAFVEKGRFYIVMDFITNSLDMLLKCQPLDETLISLYLFQVLKGLMFIHYNGYAHGRLSPEHILITTDGSVKLGDFLLYDSFPNTEQKPGVYRAPEELLVLGTNAKTDIWDVGLIIITCLCQEAMFEGWSEQSVLELFQSENAQERIDSLIVEKLTKRAVTLSPDCMTFLRKCLCVDRELRPTARDLMAEPFLRGINSKITRGMVAGHYAVTCNMIDERARLNHNAGLVVPIPIVSQPSSFQEDPESEAPIPQEYRDILKGAVNTLLQTQSSGQTIGLSSAKVVASTLPVPATAYTGGEDTPTKNRGTISGLKMTGKRIRKDGPDGSLTNLRDGRTISLGLDESTSDFSELNIPGQLQIRSDLIPKTSSRQKELQQVESSIEFSTTQSDQGNKLATSGNGIKRQPLLEVKALGGRKERGSRAPSRQPVIFSAAESTDILPSPSAGRRPRPGGPFSRRQTATSLGPSSKRSRKSLKSQAGLVDTLAASRNSISISRVSRNTTVTSGSSSFSTTDSIVLSLKMHDKEASNLDELSDLSASLTHDQNVDVVPLCQSEPLAIHSTGSSFAPERPPARLARPLQQPRISSDIDEDYSFTVRMQEAMNNPASLSANAMVVDIDLDEDTFGNVLPTGIDARNFLRQQLENNKRGVGLGQRFIAEEMSDMFSEDTSQKEEVVPVKRPSSVSKLAENASRVVHPIQGTYGDESTLSSYQSEYEYSDSSSPSFDGIVAGPERTRRDTRRSEIEEIGRILDTYCKTQRLNDGMVTRYCELLSSSRGCRRAICTNYIPCFWYAKLHHLIAEKSLYTLNFFTMLVRTIETDIKLIQAIFLMGLPLLIEHVYIMYDEQAQYVDSLVLPLFGGLIHEYERLCSPETPQEMLRNQFASCDTCYPAGSHISKTALLPRFASHISDTTMQESTLVLMRIFESIIASRNFSLLYRLLFRPLTAGSSGIPPTQGQGVHVLQPHELVYDLLLILFQSRVIHKSELLRILLSSGPDIVSRLMENADRAVVYIFLLEEFVPFVPVAEVTFRQLSSMLNCMRHLMDEYEALLGLLPDAPASSIDTVTFSAGICLPRLSSLSTEATRQNSYIFSTAVTHLAIIVKRLAMIPDLSFVLYEHLPIFLRILNGYSHYTTALPHVLSALYSLVRGNMECRRQLCSDLQVLTLLGTIVSLEHPSSLYSVQFAVQLILLLVRTVDTNNFPNSSDRDHTLSHLISHFLPLILHLIEKGSVWRRACLEAIVHIMQVTGSDAFLSKKFVLKLSVEEYKSTLPDLLNPLLLLAKNSRVVTDALAVHPELAASIALIIKHPTSVETKVAALRLCLQLCSNSPNNFQTTYKGVLLLLPAVRDSTDMNFVIGRQLSKQILDIA
ncbi:Kinase, STE STE11 [Giardia muris]|uniref:non-specific serine/threonine protein kinase n=1 Tax=Giardia muris TaxID=5742 RepID=A0A4Z1T3X2_GIAMU|nr:Kinase, STE STE11 [Giardia muris]|eukprot:TNJ30348.1 Kinase, STE STE11 [Giardia muris]